jgi:putative NIF3 family GTP cyclohydrolase 1 type 2
MYLESIIKTLEDLAPAWLSPVEGEQRGLVFGRKTAISNIVIRKCVVSVAPTMACIDDAVAAKASLIISHHALFPGSIFDVREVAFEKLRLLTEHNIWVHVLGDAWNCAGEGITESICQAMKFSCDEKFASTKRDGIAIPVGRLCTMMEHRTFKNVLEQAKTSIRLPFIKFGGNLDEKVKKILVIGGKIESTKYIQKALEENVDTIIGGEYSDDILAILTDLGLKFIELSHHASDLFGISKLRMLLSLKHPNVTFDFHDTNLALFF